MLPVFSCFRTIAVCILCCAFLASCDRVTSRKNRVVIVQPFGDFPRGRAARLYPQIAVLHQRVVIRPALPLPSSAFYAPRSRYRADSLLNYLEAYGSSDSVIIALTTQDISVTKGDIADWGIMGFARRPGNVCVVSTFRLNRQRVEDQLYKVAVHELGHSQGLPHCSERTCYMRNAEGGNPLDEETGFCRSCKSFLIDKGWRL